MPHTITDTHTHTSSHSLRQPVGVLPSERMCRVPKASITHPKCQRALKYATLFAIKPALAVSDCLALGCATRFGCVAVTSAEVAAVTAAR